MVIPAQTPSVDTVIFDFGNVVVQWSMSALLCEFFDTSEALDDFLTNVLTPEDNLRCDLGEPLADVVAELIARHPQHRAPLEAWRDRWIETLPGLVEGTQDLIDDLLAAGWNVVGLSNFNAETFLLCVAKFDVFHKFSMIVLSGEEGIAKPNPEIYRRLLQQIDRRPDQCVFLDDSIANVEAGNALGIRSLLFDTAAHARFWLEREIGLTGL